MLKLGHFFRIISIVGTVLAGWNLAAAGEAAIDAFEKQFRELPPEARRLTGPLFWLHGDDSKERLEMYVGKVTEGGNGSFTPESRPHTDWLGEGWWRDLSICLEAAKKNNLEMWIFDEKWWPSQVVAGNVPPQYAAKQLDATTLDVDGPRDVEADDYAGENYIAAVAGKLTTEGKIEGDSLADLASSINNGKLNWKAPAGKWRIIKFTFKTAPKVLQSNQWSVDGASQDCVDWYIQTVYQPHYDRYKDDFGKTIRGYFYDEPEVAGDWGTELNKILAERKIDWKKPYVAQKFELAGDEQAAARYQYRDALAEAWGRTMYGGITKWCEQHNVKSIGHFMEHSALYIRPDFCGGDMMKLQKYSSMGGIDAVFDQFKMGARQIRDVPCWQTPKLGSSITHAYGKPDDISMVEIFGARGQDLTYPEMKWWTDHMHVSGVNFLIPHSFNPKSPHDTDCPPYFYNGGFEPRWPLYRVFADYTSRLSVMLTGGRHVAPVALLFLGQSAQVGKYVLPDQMSEVLQDALYDCDWLPYEVLENDTELAGREIKLRDESYKVLVVPPVEVIPYATLAWVKEFFDHGGVVMGYGFLPSKSATLGKNSADIAKLRDAIWGEAKPGEVVCKTSEAGGRSYLLPEKPTAEQIQKVLAGDANIHPTLEVLEGRTDNWLHVLHRVKAGRDLFFVTNQNHTGEPRTFKFRITADGEPECWDAMRNEITAVPYTRNSKQVELSLTMEPLESVLLVFQAEKRPLPMRIEPGSGKAESTITVTRIPSPPAEEPKLDVDMTIARTLEDCSWVWYPEGSPATKAAPGKCTFRKPITVPADRRIKQAVFTGTADNKFVLYVNGKNVGHGDNSAEGWRKPVRLDVTQLLHAGANQLAIVATNGSDKPNPAGLLGKLVITFEQGEAMNVPVDKTWKTSRGGKEEWTVTGFDDKDWVAAMEVIQFGGLPWGPLTGDRITMSPAKADPFDGRCELPASVDLKQSRVFLEMDSLAPETAARITINGQYTGGVLCKPLRLDVTQHLKTGENKIRIEPFAPTAAKLSVYAK